MRSQPAKTFYSLNNIPKVIGGRNYNLMSQLYQKLSSYTRFGEPIKLALYIKLKPIYVPNNEIMAVGNYSMGMEEN
jgi:hypothetical protein